MSANLIWANLVAYSLQIGLLVGLAAFVPAALRLRLPGARLVYWHVLLAACLLLPMVRPWKQEAAGTVQVSTSVAVVVPRAARAAAQPSTAAKWRCCCWPRARWLAWAGWRRDSGGCANTGAIPGRSNRRLPGASRPTCAFPATWPAR